MCCQHTAGNAGGTDMRSRARPHPVIADMWTLDPWQYKPLFTKHLFNCVRSFVINDIYKRVSETSRCRSAGEYKHVVLTGASLGELTSVHPFGSVTRYSDHNCKKKVYRK